MTGKARWPFRLAVAFLLVVGVPLWGVLFGSQPLAHAASGVSHCYSEIVGNGSFSGAESQFHNEGLTIPNTEIQAGGHITNELWLLTHNSPSLTSWVEEGLADSCTVFFYSGTRSSNHGVPEYQLFWADDGTSFYFHSKGAQSANGSNNVYEIWDPSNGANNEYNIYYNYTIIGHSTIQTVSSGVQLQAGMELYAVYGINANEYSGNFNNYVQGYQNGVGWKSLTPSNSYGVANDGCGSGYPQGKCLNGIAYQTSEWSDSKPS